MKSPTVTSLLLASTLLAVLLPGCSSNDSSTNPTPTPVAEPFESGDMPTGRSFQRTFTNAGSFTYRCRFHPGMAGVVNVSTGTVDSMLVTITNNAFNPTPAAINPGGYVRWINNGSTHSVTRP